jgi:uncharacterized protein YjeT (DUF2065 family)
VGLTSSSGLTPLEDQQLGGLIMWIPAGLVYVIAGLALFAGWLRESELRAFSALPLRPLRLSGNGRLSTTEAQRTQRKA